jgi:hypothetical protein
LHNRRRSQLCKKAPPPSRLGRRLDARRRARETVIQEAYKVLSETRVLAAGGEVIVRVRYSGRIVGPCFTLTMQSASSSSRIVKVGHDLAQMQAAAARLIREISRPL